MTFEELKDGMKSLFSSLGAKTSDSNYAVGLYDKTSAEPKGLMGMSDLASVLGGIDDIYVQSFVGNITIGTISLNEGCGVFAFRCLNQSCGLLVVKATDIKYYTNASNDMMGARLQATSDGTVLTIKSVDAWNQPFHLKRIM